MNTKVITNLKATVKLNGVEQFTERYLLPDFRQENDRLVKEAQDEGVEPIIVVGADDGLWWNDDLYFLFDRMDCCEGVARVSWPKELEEFKDEIDAWKPTVEGETKTYTHGDLEITMVADVAPMTNGRIERIG